MIRKIATSQVFGLSSKPSERNVSDTRNFSRYYRERMRAEVLLDAVNDVLVPARISRPCRRAPGPTQAWTHRVPSVFLDTFGRPDLNQDPPCERKTDATTPQLLHLMNSAALNRKMALDTTRPAKLAASKEMNEKLVEELYLLAYCRFPTDDEKRTALASLPAQGNRRGAVEDLFWCC